MHRSRFVQYTHLGALYLASPSRSSNLPGFCTSGMVRLSEFKECYCSNPLLLHEKEGYPSQDLAMLPASVSGSHTRGRFAIAASIVRHYWGTNA